MGRHGLFINVVEARNLVLVDPALELESAALLLSLIAVVCCSVAVHACQPTAQALA